MFRLVFSLLHDADSPTPSNWPSGRLTPKTTTTLGLVLEVVLHYASLLAGQSSNQRQPLHVQPDALRAPGTTQDETNETHRMRRTLADYGSCLRPGREGHPNQSSSL